jgi:peroxiredoxin
MPRHRLASIAIVAVAGLVAVVASLVVLAVVFDDAAPVDGQFVLDEPGIFQEPLDDVNADVAGDRLPDVVLTDASGAPVTLADYRGAPLVVNFWFSRCAPCRRELRDFASVHAEVGDTIQFVGIDPFDTVDAMLAFASDRGVTYDLLRDTGDGDDARLLSDELGLVAYPVTLFVDADGRILRQTGEVDADELRTAIEELF